MTNSGRRRWIGCSAWLVLAASLPLAADDAAPQPTPAGAAASPPGDLPPESGPRGGASSGALRPIPEGSPILPQGLGAASGSSGIIPPVPVYSGGYSNCGSYGWGTYYTPSYYAPTYTVDYGYPASWNGYWNYSTAYGAPGYTAYWHGWYAGPTWYVGAPVHACGWRGRAYWDYAWPTYSYHGWGYGANLNWGWGHSYSYPWAYHPWRGRWGMIHAW